MDDPRLKPEDTALLIHIEHKKPVEISDFVAMLHSVGNLYSSYTRSQSGTCGENPKLYVKKIVIDERSKTMQQNELKNQLMTVHQMVGDKDKTKGNKAIIEAVEKRAVGLLFESEELKMRILHMDENPTKKAFYVDVVPMYANGRLAAYKVTALHDIIDLQE